MEITFGSQGSITSMKAEGWDVSEPWSNASWNIQKIAKLDLTAGHLAAKLCISVEVTPFLRPGEPWFAQPLICFYGQRWLGVGRARERSILQFGVEDGWGGRDPTIYFHFPLAKSPRDLGAGPDERPLAFLFHRIQIRTRDYAQR